MDALPLVIWALTVLIPVNGLIWIGMMNERRRIRALALFIQRRRRKY